MESLYEELSLFDGDLLPAGPWSNKDVSEVRDGSGEGWLSPGVSFGGGTLVTSEGVLFPELFNSSPSSPLDDQIDGTVLETNWLDTQTNLLDLLVDPTLSQQLVVEQLPAPTEDVQLLDMSAASAHLNKLGFELVNIQAPSTEEVGGNDLAMSLMDVVNELAGSLENDTAVLSGEIEQPHSFVVEPLLSPISVEEVESLLSSQPTSPSSSYDDSGYIEDSFEDPAYSPGPSREAHSHTDVRSAPYSKRGPKAAPSDRKQRKKQQNKDAALRYRQKKKVESTTVGSECDQLQSRNTELKDKVDGLAREIGYLKDLMTQVYKAKGVSIPNILTSSS